MEIYSVVYVIVTLLTIYLYCLSIRIQLEILTIYHVLLSGVLWNPDILLLFHEEATV